MLIGLALGWNLQAAFLLGVMISPSGTSIIATILVSREKVNTAEGTMLLTAAVVDDVEGVLLLSIALRDWGQEGFSPLNFVWTTVLAVIFIFGAIYLGRGLFPKLIDKMEHHLSEEVLFAILLGFGFIVAFCATLVGLAAITGGFIVGVLIPYKKVGEKLDQKISMMKNIFTVMFFTSIGLSIDPSSIPGLLPVALLVLGVGIAARLGGGLLGGKLGGFSGRSLWAMGSGLAQAGITLGIVGPDFLVIAAVVVLGSIFILMPIYQKLSRSLH